MCIFLLLGIMKVHAQEVSTEKDSLLQEKATTQNSLEIAKETKKRLLRLVDITQSWSKYQPATLDPVNWRPLKPKADILNTLLRSDIIMFNQNRMDPAIDSLMLEIQADSMNYNLYNVIGVKYGKIGYFDEGREYFQQAIIIEPTFFKAVNNMGNIYFKEGKFEKAYEYYHKSASLAEDNPDILINWAYAALELGNVEEAAELENRAFDLNQELRTTKTFRVITEIETGLAMKASEGTKSTLEPIWIE